MLAPTWQYIVLMVIFCLGASLNVISLGLMLFLESIKPEALKFEQRALGAGSLLVKTLMGIFAAYLSYSLYIWSPGALSLGIMIVHWASIIVSYILSIANAGKAKTYTYGQHVFGAIYTTGMVIALIFYGVKCL